MTGRYKAYTQYKASLASWCGNVPKHWSDIKFKWIFEEKKKTSNPALPSGAISFGEVVFKNEDNLAPETKASYQEVLKGELLINPLNLNFDLKSLRTALSNIDVVVSTGYIVTHIAIGIDTNYMRWVMHQFDVSHMKTLGSGVRQTINFTDIANSIVSIAPLKEQQKIANFLDHETDKIDTLITKQEKLIELLKEKRQAVISHAVTKGLNPSVPMRNSGVEWLGEVPEHWGVSQLKHHVNTVNGFGFSSSDFQDKGVPFIRAGNIKNKTIVKPDIHLPLSVVNKYQRVIMNAGELIISMVGSDPRIKASAVGQVGIVPPSLAGSVPNQNVVILREKTSIIKQFLFYVVCGTPYRYHLDVFSHKLANQSIISSSLIINAHFVFPEIEEQTQIVDFLNTQLKKYDALIGNATRSIELMKERKTALISAAVTGKIDVRDWRAN